MVRRMPLVSKTFDQLLDFTRTTAATFVGSNGLIQNTAASRNLFTFTQEFDNAAWTKTAAAVTANTTVAPDGTSTADTITEDTAAASNHRVFRSFATAAVAHTASVYFKAGTRSWAYIRLTDSGNAFRHAYFDLSTGTLGTVETNLTASITDAGNGWYRCVATVSAAFTTSTTVFGIANANGGASYDGNGTGNLFIWGAQYEVGSTATTYTRNNGGVFPPRFDYDPVTLAPKGILIEEQRTNLLTYSEQFDNAAWIKQGAGTGSVPVITANAAVAPDGTTTADLVVMTLNGGTTNVDQSLLRRTGAHLSALSVYLKTSDSTTVQIHLRNGSSSVIVTVTPTWQRFSLVNLLATDTTLFIGLRGGVGGVTNAVNLHIWGAQLEAGAFATSYIPTVASQVTRTADNTSIVAPNFAPWYNQSEGTLSIEASVSPNVDGASGNYYVAISDGTSSNAINIVDINGTVSQIVTGGVTQFNQTVGAKPTGILKAALAYASNNTVSSANGAIGATDTSVALPTVTSLLIGIRGDASGSTSLNGHIRSIQYYPVRLSDAQLQALTA